MSIELQNDIKSSVILKVYNKFSKLRKIIPAIKWILGISFLIAFVDTVIDGETSTISMWTNIISWIPAMTLAFVGAILHLLTGIKLGNLAAKHDMNIESVKVWAEEILN